MYYYHTQNKTSVWVKPKEFADREADLAAARVIAECPWKEHTAPDGRLYYHNKASKQSVWKVPPELAAARQQAAALRAGITTPGAGGGGPDAAKAAAAAAPVVAEGEFMYKTKDEAMAAFKAFLSDAKPPREGKWDTVLKGLQVRLPFPLLDIAPPPTVATPPPRRSNPSAVC